MKTNLVSCCILKNKNKFLVSQRTLSKIFANFWEFPGGKLENNESFQNAIIRELKEELGIRVNKKNLINLDVITHAYKKNEITILSIFFLKKWSGTVKAREGQKIEWLNIAQIKKLNFLEGSKVILSKLSSGFYNFYF